MAAWSLIGPLIATSTTATVAVAGLGLSLLQRNRESLEQRIGLAIDGKIGATLLNLRTLEDAARERRDAEEADVAKLDDLLTKSIARSKEFEERVSHVETQILPSMEISDVPAVLAIQAAEATDRGVKTAILMRLLDHSTPDTTAFETGGDVARSQLRNDVLARRLYQRAVEADALNISARAELLHILASIPPEREQAKEQIIALAKANPGERTVISRLLDFFIEVDDYSGMRTICEQLLEVSPFQALIWRNLGIARAEMRESRERVLEAYEKAITAAEETDGRDARDDFVNTVRPFASYLLRISETDRAIEIVRRAIEMAPRTAQLYLHLGEVLDRSNNGPLAATSYEMAIKYGNPFDRAIAEQRRLDIAARNEFRQAFALPVLDK